MPATFLQMAQEKCYKEKSLTKCELMKLGSRLAFAFLTFFKDKTVMGYREVTTETMHLLGIYREHTGRPALQE